MKLSVIMPVRAEPFMQKTIDSLLAASFLGKDLEVIVVLDGPDEPWPLEDPNGRVKVIRFAEPRGMRQAVNAGVAHARGRYIMKVDAHCAFALGFDATMLLGCPPGCLMIPRRFALDDEIWGKKAGKPPRDYHYLSYEKPMSPQHYRPEGCDLRLMDDTMVFQGSCWMADAAYFSRRVGTLDDKQETYGPFAAEQIEIGLKYWLGGGRVMVNKRTWYAHLFKMARHYATGQFERKRSSDDENWAWVTRHWRNDEEPGMIYPFSWLLEKFWPVPGWPKDRSQWRIA